MSSTPAISGPQVQEPISIDHTSHPQRPSDAPMVALTPRNRAHFVASRSPAPLASDDIDHILANTHQNYTHQWVPAGDFSAPVDPSASADGWGKMPYTSTASKMSEEVLFNKAVSLAFSTHIMASKEYAHQTTSVKEWITSFRSLRIRKPADSPATDFPSEMQQVLSSSSIKELQRQGSMSTAIASKWTEAYVCVNRGCQHVCAWQSAPIKSHAGCNSCINLLALAQGP
eukprot:3628879-Amphidinium_carterae.1